MVIYFSSSVVKGVAAAWATAAMLLNDGGSLAGAESQFDDELLVSVRMAFIHLVFIPVLGKLNFLPVEEEKDDPPLSPPAISTREPYKSRCVRLI